MFSFGFYNSVNGDRKYDALQMSSIFDGIIKDGIFASVGSKFAVSVVSGMQIKIGDGRAWFNHTWSWNSTDYPLVLQPADILNDRIDIVILEVNTDDSVRANAIKILQGTPSSSPVPPTLIRSEKLNQYPLANILVRTATTSILSTDITTRVGTPDAPFAQSIYEMDEGAIFDMLNDINKRITPATQAEVTAGIITNKFVVPGNAISSQTDKGLVRAATDAEVESAISDNIYVSPSTLKKRMGSGIGEGRVDGFFVGIKQIPVSGLTTEFASNPIYAYNEKLITNTAIYDLNTKSIINKIPAVGSPSIGPVHINETYAYQVVGNVITAYYGVIPNNPFNNTMNIYRIILTNNTAAELYQTVTIDVTGTPYFCMLADNPNKILVMVKKSEPEVGGYGRYSYPAYIFDILARTLTRSTPHDFGMVAGGVTYSMTRCIWAHSTRYIDTCHFGRENISSGKDILYPRENWALNFGETSGRIGAPYYHNLATNTIIRPKYLTDDTFTSHGELKIAELMMANFNTQTIEELGLFILHTPEQQFSEKYWYKFSPGKWNIDLQENEDHVIIKEL